MYKKPNYIDAPFECPKCGFRGPFKVITNESLMCPKCGNSFYRDQTPSVFTVDIQKSRHSKKNDPYGLIDDDLFKDIDKETDPDNYLGL